jgi:hypothetical protein
MRIEAPLLIVRFKDIIYWFIAKSEANGVQPAKADGVFDYGCSQGIT